MRLLTDKQWVEIDQLLPKKKMSKGGRPRVGDRVVLEGILWVLRSGGKWSHLPEKYGAYVTVWRRYSEWQKEGLWGKVWRAYFRNLSERERLEWVLAFVDGNFVPGK